MKKLPKIFLVIYMIVLIVVTMFYFKSDGYVANFNAFLYFSLTILIIIFVILMLKDKLRDLLSEKNFKLIFMIYLIVGLGIYLSTQIVGQGILIFIGILFGFMEWFYL